MTRATRQRRLSLGPEVAEAGTHFRVLAPKRNAVAVVVDGGPTVPLEREPGDDGYFSGLLTGVHAGALYCYRLDDGEAFPDPASRYQPQGVHGPSEVIDATTYAWRDADWKGVTPRGQVLYEMHVGTFTPEGTYAAAAEKLPHLKALGITCIEMMPVAELAGRWNWGYDGVAFFSPTRNYGPPDSLRRFVDRAHGLGIGVILDVVYNHFGPDGNYLEQFSDTFFTDKHKNDWGKAINYDGPGSAPVRQFFLDNARYWIEEFHFDGFRFDATQAIVDDSPTHILSEITRAARSAAGSRSIYLVNENEPQQTRLVRDPAAGGIGMDALWNDDFHHTARVAMTGRRDAYFTDYHGSAQEMLSALKWGYLYQGQHYQWQGKRRGTPALGLEPTAFVNYIQNHDQIANYAFGERLHRHTSLARLRAITALMLLAPQTPMLFMGQEWGASAPFNFFSDLCGDLPDLVAQGRKKEMSQFPSVGTPAVLELLPDPCHPDTFMRSKLSWDEAQQHYHRQLLELHRDLLTLRREDRIFSQMQRRRSVDGAVIGPWALAVRYFDPAAEEDDRLIVVNLDGDEHLDIVPEPLLAPPAGKRWDVLLSTEHPKYGGNGFVPPESQGEAWRMPGENWRLLSRCATVLKAVPA